MCQILRDRYGNISYLLRYDEMVNWRFQSLFLRMIIMQCGILTWGHNTTWNSDPSTYLLPVELRLKKVSKFNSAIKIQQLRRVTIQRKIH